MSDLSVMGLAEVLPHLPRLVRRLNETTAAARAAQARRRRDRRLRRVSACRLAHHLRGSGIPVIHYVAPQLWAWRSGPRPQAREARSITSWPCCRSRCRSSPNTAFPRTYVGHPAIESAPNAATARPSGRAMACRPDAPILCVLPGSRRRRSAPHASRVRRGAAERSRRTTPSFASSSRWSHAAADAVRDITRDWPFRSCSPRWPSASTRSPPPTPPWPNRAP